MSAATQPNFPQADFPLVDAKGVVTEPWARFFQFVWQKVGGSSAPTTSLYLSVVAGAIHVFDSSTGTDVGTLVTTTSTGEAVVTALTSAPGFIGFTAQRSGFVVASGGTMTVARNSADFQFSEDGGTCPLMRGDQIGITFPIGDPPPTVHFFPN